MPAPSYARHVLPSDAESIARLRDQQAVVIVGVDRDGKVTIVRYDEDKTFVTIPFTRNVGVKG